MTQQAWFCHPHDLVEEGAAEVLDRLQGAGASGLVMATVYHSARDISPHSPRGRIRFLRGGVHYYRSERDLYDDSGLLPDDAHGLDDADPLATARTETRNRGMELSAWLVLFHSSRLGTLYPDRMRVSAFGDRVLTDLCPAHPDVRAYGAALVRDVARYQPDSVHLESVHHALLGHGYHHERYLVDLDEWAQLALGLCFCTHCVQAAERSDCDAAAVRRWATDAVDGAMAGRAAPRSRHLNLEEASADLDGEVGKFLRARQQTTTESFRVIVDALADSGVRTVYVDQAGALAGYAHGRPVGPPTVERAWELGIDPVALAELADEYAVLGYAADPARVTSDLAAYQQRLPEPTGLRVALRAGIPDVAADAPRTELEAKAAAVRDAGATWLDFYHYGLVTLGDVDRAAAAWTSTAGER